MGKTMSDLLTQIEGGILTLTLNRPEKHNAFDDKLIADLTRQIDHANTDQSIRVIVLCANGTSFSAGADLTWMQSMIDYSEEQNLNDSLALAKLMQGLHKSKKPTIACVQGAAFGGGAGLVAACDIAIGCNEARFCFSEVKLGLIPAVISPYVIKAIGARFARRYFLTAEIIDAQKAKDLGLVHQLVEKNVLMKTCRMLAQKIAANAPIALEESKALIDAIYANPIDEQLIAKTAKWIAKIRVSKEGQHGINAFLNKTTPHWV
jgi:methylglutaconyl-CoA hydratase